MSKIPILFMQYLSYCWTTLFLFSCNSVIEREYYDNTGNIKTERKYFSEEKGNYELISYYPNGQMKSKGLFADSLKDGEWEYWLEDGVKENTILYEHGRILYGTKNRKIPQLLFEKEHLKIGLTSSFRIIDLYPNEQIRVSNNAILRMEENAQYVTPQNGDSVVFYCRLLEEINMDDACKEKVKSIINLPQEELDQTSLYRTKNIRILSLPISK